MVLIKKEVLQGIPCLHAVKEGLEKERLPLVLFVHGFESTKERNVQYAYMLADEGYRVILPEAIYHGERKGRGNKEISFRFWEIVLNTIEELGTLKEELAHRNLVNEARVGIGGTSMGGIVTLGALTRYDWVAAGVCMMGTPDYEAFSRRQLDGLKRKLGSLPMTDEQIESQLAVLRPYDAAVALKQGKWEARPLYFWHGKKDETVPYENTYDFYRKLKPLYEETGIPISIELDDKAGHAVPNDAVYNAVHFLKNNL